MIAFSLAVSLMIFAWKPFNSIGLSGSSATIPTNSPEERLDSVAGGDRQTEEESDKVCRSDAAETDKKNGSDGLIPDSRCIETEQRG
jgi:hypothetical protein